jgi:hypothetical protein
VDGTYKLLLNGWVLIVMATTCLKRDSWIREEYRGNEAFHHTCRPMLFILSRTETTVAYQSGFQMLKKAYSMFFDTSLEVFSCSMDRAVWIMNAVLKEFEGIQHLVNCWAHVKRKATNTTAKARLANKDYMEHIKDMLHQCELAPSLAIFRLLVSKLTMEMRKNGEDVYVDWFEKIYLAQNWDGWWHGAGGRSGSPSSNNPMESFNMVLKLPHLIEQGMPLPKFLDEGMKRIATYVNNLFDSTVEFKQSFANNQVEEVLNNPIPTEMTDKAMKLLQNSIGSIFIPDIGSMFINTSEFSSHSMTEGRARKFYEHKHSIESVPDTDMLASVSWFQLVYQMRSMHEVKYDRTSKGLRAICDCKNYTKCGLCSHCLYVLHMAKEIDLFDLCRKIQDTGRAGRRKRPLDLTVETRTQRTTRLPLFVGLSVYNSRYGIGTVIAEFPWMRPSMQWMVLFLNTPDAGGCTLCASGNCVTDNSKHLLLFEDQLLDMIEESRRMLSY